MKDEAGEGGLSPRVAALIGVLLCLPGALMYVLLTLNIDPTFGLFARRNSPDEPDLLGSAIALGLLVLLPSAAFVLNLVVRRRAVRTGRGGSSRRANLVVAMAALLIVAVVVGTIVMDQYPCWAGVPNCD